MPTIDLGYDEDRGNTPRPDCPLSIAREEDFFTSTEHVMGYEEPEDGDAAYMIAPHISFERIVREGGVDDPKTLNATRLLPACIHVDSIADAIEALVEHGLLAVEDGEDDDETRVFETYDELLLMCDKIIRQHPEEPRFQFDDSSFDNYEPFAAGGRGQWVNGVMMDKVTRKTGNLTLYVQMAELLGPRALAADRDGAESQFAMMVDGPDRGLLITTVKSYYYGNRASATPAAFASSKLFDFLFDTRWDFPWGIASHDPAFYTLDLPSRADKSTATRAQWPGIIRERIVSALPRLFPLDLLLGDVASQAGIIIRELQAVGDAVLPGDTAQKLVFQDIVRVRDYVAEHYTEYIQEQRGAGKGSLDLCKLLIAHISAQGGVAPGLDKEGAKVPEGEKFVAPKPNQIRRALVAASCVRLERTYLLELREGTSSSARTLEIIGDALHADTVLTKAVLLASSTTKVSAFTNQSEFLNLLKDCQSSMPLYIGQSLAYDEVEKEVADHMELFQFDEDQLHLLYCGRWAEMDPLNFILLALFGRDSGVEFATHNVRKLHHFTGMFEHLIKHVSKLYWSIGYPREVDESRGLTYAGFMRKLQALVQRSLAMDTLPKAKLLAFVDRCVKIGHERAAVNWSTVVYGSSPADRKLGPWLPASEPLLMEVNDMITELKGIAKFLKKTQGVLAPTQQAPMLPEWEAPLGGASSSSAVVLGGGGVDLEEEDGSTHKAKKQKKEAAKKAAEKAAAAAKAAAVAGGKDDDAKPMAGAALMKLSKEERVQKNVKRVFYYDDGSYSKKTNLFDWEGICKKYGWDAKQLCGCYVMSHNEPANRAIDCQDLDHKVTNTRAS
jgi:hypothetical protein